ncbi:MAG TPA: membrane protein insertase YidC [Hyphomicrobiaceae bacterium]|nr:membrane protein insertase YidC [Hyphomicrobiaceae bacterium]
MNDKESQKNLVMAIALSMAVLLGWQYFFVWPKEQERRALEQARQQTKASVPAGTSGATPVTPGATPSAATSGKAPAAGGATPGSTELPAATLLTRDAAIAASPRLKVETANLSGSIALKGGRIDDLTLKRYTETIKPGSPNIRLFEPTGTEKAYFAEYGWVLPPGQNVKVPDRETIWTASQPTLTPAAPVVLTWDNGQGVTFRRTIMIDDRFMFTIKDAVENKSPNAISLQPYARIYRRGLPKIEGWAILHEGPIGFLSPDDKNGLKELHYSDLKKDAETALKDRKAPIGEKAFPNVKGGWLGFTDKYWASALIPDQKATYDAHVVGYARTAVQDEGFQTDYIEQPLNVAPGAAAEVTNRLFAGAKEVRAIYDYKAALDLKQFDFMIDWGMFWFITKPLFWLIDKLNALLGNFGLAILAVTVFVKAAFFPLANKSYESMAKMKKLQPDMERLREQYKDDKQKMQQELMALYQKNKINPASGCLPILLQIPVFFALYKVLFVTLDMRHAPFFGWIKDLSAPDPTTIFNLFGLLPFNPGAIPILGDLFMLGVWPILMGITMWIQMQLNPKQADPTQQMIFNWMPVVFTFMLASFPAGLVIYWAWSNLLSIFQQYYIMHKNGADIHLWDNIGLSKWFRKADKKA